MNPPCSSLKQTKKQPTLQTNVPPPQSSFRRLLNLNNKDDNNSGGNGNGNNGDDENESAIKGTIIAGLLLLGVVGGLGSVGYIYRDQINAFLIQFSSFIEGIS